MPSVIAIASCATSRNLNEQNRDENIQERLSKPSEFNQTAAQIANSCPNKSAEADNIIKIGILFDSIKADIKKSIRNSAITTGLWVPDSADNLAKIDSAYALVAQAFLTNMKNTECKRSRLADEIDLNIDASLYKYQIKAREITPGQDFIWQSPDSLFIDSLQHYSILSFQNKTSSKWLGNALRNAIRTKRIAPFNNKSHELACKSIRIYETSVWYPRGNFGGESLIYYCNDDEIFSEIISTIN